MGIKAEAVAYTLRKMAKDLLCLVVILVVTSFLMVFCNFFAEFLYEMHLQYAFVILSVAAVAALWFYSHYREYPGHTVKWEV